MVLIGEIFVERAYITGHNCAIRVPHVENVVADWQPHHPIHFPPQGVINGHLELVWEGQIGHGSQQAFLKPTHHTRQRPWVIQAPMGCFGLFHPSFTAPQLIAPQTDPPNQFHTGRYLKSPSVRAPPPPGPAPAVLSFQCCPTHLFPGPAPPARARLTLLAVWLSGQTLMLRLRQYVKSSLEPLSRASALLRRTCGRERKSPWVSSGGPPRSPPCLLPDPAPCLSPPTSAHRPRPFLSPPLTPGPAPCRHT